MLTSIHESPLQLILAPEKADLSNFEHSALFPLSMDEKRSPGQ